MHELGLFFKLYNLLSAKAHSTIFTVLLFSLSIQLRVSLDLCSFRFQENWKETRNIRTTTDRSTLLRVLSDVKFIFIKALTDGDVVPRYADVIIVYKTLTTTFLSVFFSRTSVDRNLPRFFFISDSLVCP